MSEAVCFEVLDALGLVRLARRSPTLDGAVPLRVAQACMPLLEGNAFGLQIILDQPIFVERRLGRLSISIPRERSEPLAAAHRAALARLVAQGFLAKDGAWHRALRKGPVWIERTGLLGARVRLWTGLLVRPDEGVWLRVSSTGNRRNLLFDVDEAWIPDHGELVPLVVDLLVTSASSPVRLEGEIGTLAPVQPDVAIEERPLADAPAAGRAHIAFYDASYFATKKGQVTRKYRKLVTREAASRPPGPARFRLISAGPVAHEIACAGRLLTPAGEAGSESERARLRYVVHRNLVPFEARYDGHTLAIEPDRRALARGAEAVEAAWSSVFGPDFVEAHRGAIWYLTKYFTPHPPGEPHFFVKPWSFTKTGAGWSSLLEGRHGDGWDVMRGVVSTDVFFATPAVFHVHRLGEPIRVAAGEPLLHVLPVPRWMLRAGYRVARWRDA